MIGREKITVKTTIAAPIAKVWNAFTNPIDIINWNTADASWHCPKSENDLRVGGRFLSRMEAKDGSFGFDFEGTYNIINLHKEITYTMDDGRVAKTLFNEVDNKTEVETTFDAEEENTLDLQRNGWQAILNNFANYVTNKK
ncbi:MAG TPA: SRPBCC family protein [Flavobacterium sp.]|jgi:uncharacterized protein YndB with AHSA1/START domain|uniref:SRPBCC family protein n=1 Tax=Flavobacterium sp. TaxID=239 RepID=UPI002CAC38B2|nr:SRPBCC family protein [Flavobacterium sp.]HPW98318.1 SRPBCC family protein [Flavobacterium sp.]HQA75026.1 SRPBCC family protein [Flavobacterium sp.]